MKTRRAGFTLVELLLAGAAGAIVLALVVSVYSRAVGLRNKAMARTQEVRLQERAIGILRNDLRGARLSGGTLAATLDTAGTGMSSRFPGDLRFTTTGASVSEAAPGADVQEVEYYLAEDTTTKDAKGGVLTRALNGNALTSTGTATRAEALLAGVDSMEVTFFDGTDWQETWDTTTVAPKGVRVHLVLTDDPEKVTPRTPIDVYVPWLTARFTPEAATP